MKCSRLKPNVGPNPHRNPCMHTGLSSFPHRAKAAIYNTYIRPYAYLLHASRTSSSPRNTVRFLTSVAHPFLPQHHSSPSQAQQASRHEALQLPAFLSTARQVHRECTAVRPQENKYIQ